nr:hypothetical protein [Megavirus caiporensis]
MSGNYFEISVENNKLYSFSKYYNLDSVLTAIYNLILSEKSLNIVDQIKITKYYFDFPLNKFNVKFIDTIIIYNNNTTLLTSELYQEYIPFDNILKTYNINKNLFINKKSDNNIHSSSSINNHRKKRHQKFLTQKTITNNLVKKNNPSNQKIINHEKEPIYENKYLRLFESDKRSYRLIKNDIENGKLKKEDINPYFSDKYMIFKLLETRNCLNLSDDENIKEEYKLFNELYQLADDENTVENNIMPKIYIPHNYHYMTISQKENHAKNYGLTVQEFENKYLQGCCDETCVNDIIFKTQRISENNTNIDNSEFNTESNSESNSESDSESEEKYSITNIDQNFIDLTREKR